MKVDAAPASGGQLAGAVVHRLNAQRHTPALSGDTEMDEFAPIRLAVLISLTFVFVAVYVLSKVWRRPAKTRPPPSSPQDDAWGALLAERLRRRAAFGPLMSSLPLNSLRGVEMLGGDQTEEE
ncbi:hypothetical protein M3Y99_01656200 [Aphelenchoides fujianensis]|nr:hypothetical protein M3Y99_01656200 [Aphelenchoides fujianensis]